MGFITERRGVLRLMTSALAAAAAFGAPRVAGAALFSAFAQALSAAAQDDEVIGTFYSNRNYATVWTGEADASVLCLLPGALSILASRRNVAAAASPRPTTTQLIRNRSG